MGDVAVVLKCKEGVVGKGARGGDVRPPLFEKGGGGGGLHFLHFLLAFLPFIKFCPQRNFASMRLDSSLHF